MKKEEIDRRIDRAFRLHREGRVPEAETIYREVLKATPDNGDALGLLGTAAMQTGRAEEAARLIRQAIQSIPDRDHLHNNLGLALKAGGREEEALDAFRRAVRLNPENTGALNNLGNLLQRGGQAGEAEQAYLRALAVDGEDPVTLSNLGALYTEGGKPEQAIPLLEKALLGAPDDAGALLNLCNALKSAGRLEEALNCLRRALATAPDNPLVHKGLGDLHLAMGNRREAAASLERSLALDPDQPVARHLLNALTGKRSETAPREYVEALFDQYAPGFERHLVEELGYDIPRRLAAALAGLGAPPLRFENALDLGCGSGLTGLQLKGIARRLTGVDLSAAMLAAAREKGVYHRLVRGDVVDFLRSAEEAFDLVTATDTFIYVGELTNLFEILADRTRPGALFAFSTEDLEGEGFGLLPTGRFAHSAGYIRSLAESTGFAAEHAEAVPIRLEKGRWIGGTLHILRRRPH